MKGKLVIELDGQSISSSGNAVFSSEIEPYLVAATFLKCLGITTPEQLARLVVVSTIDSMRPSSSEKFERTEYRIPRKPD